MNRVCLPRFSALVLAFLFLPAVEGLAGEFYYVMIFGSQPKPKRLRDCHTWATFIKATGEGTDPNGYALEVNTISWMPASLDVKVLSLKPEPGVNLDLVQSLQLAASRKAEVTLFGPFVIGPKLWNEALEVRQKIDSGQVEYRAISTARNMLISDCIHAVAAVDPQYGRDHYPLIRVGKSASRHIARQFIRRGPVDQTVSDNSWLIPLMGLNAYPIQVVPPNSDSLQRGLSLLQFE